MKTCENICANNWTHTNPDFWEVCGSCIIFSDYVLDLLRDLSYNINENEANSRCFQPSYVPRFYFTLLQNCFQNKPKSRIYVSVRFLFSKASKMNFSKYINWLVHRWHFGNLAGFWTEFLAVWSTAECGAAWWAIS